MIDKLKEFVYTYIDVAQLVGYAAVLVVVSYLLFMR